MKQNFRPIVIKICWIIIALLLFAGCVYETLHSGDNMYSLARPLGIIMFFAGVINLFICSRNSDVIHGSNWLIADGMTATLLSFFLMFNQIIYPYLIPFFFGFWELFSGILKVMDSHELRSENIKCWIYFSIIGYIELVSGTIAMLKPVDDALGVHSVIGLIFLIQSIGFLLKSVMYKSIIKTK